MLIVSFNEKGEDVLIEMKDASTEQLIRSLELKNGNEVVISELVKRDNDFRKRLEESLKVAEEFRIKYFRSKCAMSQARLALSGGNLIF